jgi:hypothetical protein
MKTILTVDPQSKERGFVVSPPAKEMEARNEAVGNFFEAAEVGLHFISLVTNKEDSIDVRAIADRLSQLLEEAKEAQQKFEAAWDAKAKTTEMAN